MRFPAFSRKTHFFARKTAFLWKFAFLRWILLFPVKRCTFPVLGPQKTSQNLVFIKGFEQGTHKVAFGAQKCTFWHRNALFRKNSYFWCQWLEKAAELWRIWKRANKPQGIPTFRESAEWWFFANFKPFYIKINIFTENTECFARFSQLSEFFRPARPGCARSFKTNGIPYIFYDFWSPRANFPQNVISVLQNVKIHKLWFSHRI